MPFASSSVRAGLFACALVVACATPAPPIENANENAREQELERYALGPVLDDSEPPVDDEGYDGSRLTLGAGAAIEGVSWLPLVDGGRKGVPFVDVIARTSKRDVTFPALLDTGAQISLMPRAIVDDIGAVPVLDDNGAPLVRGMVDALGGTSFAAIMSVPLIVLGAFELVDVRVAVPVASVAEESAPTWPVIGFPELARMDVLLAADSGVVGLFAAGTAPPLERARHVRVAIADAAPFVVARTRTGREVRMVLDTGASSTTLPRALGLAAVEGLGENVRVLGGRSSVQRALAPPLWLGAGPNEQVALAMRAVDLTSSGIGLLGGDALMEHRSLLSAKRGTLEIAPARWGSARRVKWRGEACPSGPCIDARLMRCPPSRGALDQTCVELAVHPSIKSAVAVDVRLFDERGSLRPRAMTAVFPAGSARTDGLALPALPAHPTRLAIRVRRPSSFEDCKQGRVCWWN